ncbi:hypothetical protein F511_41963 [Dorcoceras hygrometricum]|uniref:Uncharacterized protein n=1 Tax=Dorcoceras hygrometricum TaxID=472368 RepID=A0A2Z7DE95_9LAMI|nr:hypothetical protein F511_41963 [Dorcoceras hygrometricum]
MSLFDLQDVCIVIGSLATLDLPMVVDLIGIYVLKGQYCTLTTTNWFLQALSVIPRGSWDDVARRFTMIRWANLLVQTEIAFPIVDLIKRSTAAYFHEPEFPVNLVGARRLDGSKIKIDKHPMNGLLISFNVLNVSRGKILTSAAPPGNGIRIRQCRHQVAYKQLIRFVFQIFL